MEQNNLKQDFIIELMIFSPKYNAVTAEDLVVQLSDSELTEYTEKLRRINAAEAEKLADLEESDPEAYEKKVKELEAEEEKADDNFYNQLEAKVQADTEVEEKELDAAEEQIDKLAAKAEEDIDKVYEDAESLLKTFLGELEEAQEVNNIPHAPEQVRPIKDVEHDIQVLTAQAKESEENEQVVSDPLPSTSDNNTDNLQVTEQK